ncbi:MAG: DUF5606 domain-containing protein [Candidatus Delongbacteria bacterium]|jgi:hypothetical protein|nr:DUF5606 domain-containing protein [Candidatus Delongbacteria bacterium]
MYLEGILAIGGKPGLYKMISQARNSIIVESLDTGKRFPAFASAQISSLEDIAIYTETEEKPLIEVLNNIYELYDGGQTISHKSSKGDIVVFMEKILPDYDQDRVHIGDIKKIIQWYHILIEKNILNDKAIEAYEKEQAEKEAEEEEDNAGEE